MAEYYLGERFDIHGGGLDLVFPHHENEIAQSRGAGGDFASFWLHNAWVTTAGEKMSKSLGNSLLVTEVCKRVRPIELRFYLASAHYRSALEFSFQALEESAVAFRRIEGFLNKAGSANAERPAFPDDFTNAMNDDVGVPAALAVIFAMVSQGQQRLADRDYADAAGVADVVRVMLDVLGCNPQASNWASNEGSAKNAHALSALVDLQLQQRTAARVARDWAAADAIRDALTHAGIDIEDTPDGAHWSVRIDGGE
jgi:cysteinyl-tRNA synthetase